MTPEDEVRWKQETEREEQYQRQLNSSAARSLFQESLESLGFSRTQISGGRSNEQRHGLRFVFSTSSSKSVAQCELECPRSAGAEETTGSVLRHVERAGLRRTDTHTV